MNAKSTAKMAWSSLRLRNTLVQPFVRRGIGRRNACKNDLRNRKVGILPHVRRMKRQHDVSVRHAGFEQLRRDTVVGLVGLDPNFPVAKANVKDDLSKTAFAIP